MEKYEENLDQLVYVKLSELFKDKKQLGEVFQKFRKSLNYSIHDVSFILCVHPFMIKDLENGDLDYVPMSFIKRLTLLYRRNYEFL